MNYPQVLISGYPSFDHILKVDHLPLEGETAIILDPPGIHPPMPGGCASNIAVCLARLGILSAPSLVIGDDADGLLMQQLLAEEGISTACLTVVPGGKTASTFLFIAPQGTHQTFYFPGCADAPVEIYLPGWVTKEVKYAVITVASSSHTRQILSALRDSQATLIWSLRNDPHAFPPELVHELLSRCRLLVMNRFEQQALLGWIGAKDLNSVFQYGVEALIVTLGENGSLILHSDGEIRIPAVPPRNLVDPTGAGDAYLGGLLAGLTYSYSLENSAKIGAVTASFVLEDWGCQTSLPNWETMEQRFFHAFGAHLHRKVIP